VCDLCSDDLGDLFGFDADTNGTLLRAAGSRIFKFPSRAFGDYWEEAWN